MNINVEHQPNCRAVLHIELPADVIKQERTAILSTYAAQARIPGYRPGKVPAAVIEKRYKDAVDGELQNRLVNLGCYRAIEKENLEVIQVLSVRDTKLQGDGSFTFTAEVSTAPKFELPEYKGIPVKLERVVVTDHDVEHEIFHLRERQQQFNDVERPAELGDAVVLNYVAKMDGQPLEETHPDLPVHFRKIEGNWFLLDSEEDFLPGFYAGLVGIKAGESRDLTISVPEDFHNDVLKGKSIDLAVTCTSVKQKKLPEVDDAFAKQLLGEEATLESLRKEVEASVRQRREQGREQSLGNQVLGFLHDKLDFELPAEIVEREAQNRANDLAMRAARQGMPEEDILKHQDEILNTASQQARQNVRLSFILEQIAQKENLTVSDAQVSIALSNLAARSKQSPKKFMADAQRNGLINRLRDNLRIESAVDFLKQHAVIEDVDPVTEAHGCEFEKAEAKA
jgi:trigger factor